MTIEHIYPEHPANGKPLPAKVTGALGNLILVSEPLNAKLDNKPFVEKRALYHKENVPMDPVLKKASTWGAVQVKERTELLAKLLYEKILKV